MEPLPEELWQCWIGCFRIEQCNAVRFDVLVGLGLDGELHFTVTIDQIQNNLYSWHDPSHKKR